MHALSSRPPLGGSALVSHQQLQRGLGGPLALSRPPVAVVRAGRSRRALRSVAEGGSNDRNNYNARKGKQWENSKRRRGRPAHMRSPYDSPLRDGNRDRLIGLLTERAAKTLMVYLMETNANVYSWLVEFYKANPIPRHGSWDEVSGESFLRKLLSMPIEEAKFNTGRDSLFDNVTSCGVDPRSIAQRIMDIRTQLSEEFVQELQAIAEENSLLLRESLQTSLSIDSSSEDAAATAAAEAAASGTQLHPEVANPPAPAPASSGDAAGKPGSITGSTSSGKGSKGAMQTPPPSPASGGTKAPSSSSSKSSSSTSKSSSSSSSEKMDNAAAVAALNAALKASSAAGSGAVRKNDSSSDKVNVPDVLAQLRRAMDADVAREVSKMTGVPPPAAAAAPATPADSDSTAVPAAAAAGDEASTAEAPTQEEEEQQQQQPAVNASEADAAAAVVPAAAAAAGVEEGEDSGADIAPAAADEDAASVPAAAAAVGGDSDADEAAAADPAAASATLVGVSGTYSRTLPKGWGPRLGVGFSRFPRVPSHNNIVSTAGLVGPKAADQQQAGSEGVEV